MPKTSLSSHYTAFWQQETLSGTIFFSVSLFREEGHLQACDNQMAAHSCCKLFQSICSGVSSKASEMRTPVSCSRAHSVRTSRGAFLAAARKVRRSSAVR